MRFIIAALLFTLLVPGAAGAQDRIAYANVELILALMPGTAKANQTMGAFTAELREQLQTKEKYAQQKLSEAQAAVAAGAPEAELEAFRQDLNRIDAEIRTLAAESEQQIATKRGELMDPIIERLSATLREIAAENSYDFILNALDGSGTSVVLYGRDDRDITRMTLEKLGIQIPTEPAE